jgi:hypothetical protein
MILNLSENNKDEIEELINNHDNVVILYYSVMCYYCNLLKPTWIKLCEFLKDKKNIVIINVESSNIRHLKTKYIKGITGYPTIIKYCKGKNKSEYNGNRQLSDLKKFCKKII